MTMIGNPAGFAVHRASVIMPMWAPTDVCERSASRKVALELRRNLSPLEFMRKPDCNDRDDQRNRGYRPIKAGSCDSHKKSVFQIVEQRQQSVFDELKIHSHELPAQRRRPSQPETLLCSCRIPAVCASRSNSKLGGRQSETLLSSARLFAMHNCGPMGVRDPRFFFGPSASQFAMQDLRLVFYLDWSQT